MDCRTQCKFWMLNNLVEERREWNRVICSAVHRLTNIDVPVIRLRKLKEFVHSKLSDLNEDSVGKDSNFDLLHVHCDGSDSL